MVKWSDSAIYDLRQIYDYISRNSTHYGKKVVDDIVGKSEKIGEFPNLGKKVVELNNPRIRETLIYSYRMIYQVIEEKEIEILAIVHTKSNFSLTERD